MNFAQVSSLLRLGLGLGGGAVIENALHVPAGSVSGAVSSSTSYGQLVVGLIPVVASGLWGLFHNKVSATVDRAVKMTGGSASALAPSAPLAKVQAGTVQQPVRSGMTK